MKVQEGYKYSSKPRNLFRTMLATWRVLKDNENLDANVAEAAIVEIYFNRSRPGRKIARWDLLAKELIDQHPEVTEAMNIKRRISRVDLHKLIAMPVGSFGHTFAQLSLDRGIDPNIVEPLPDTTDADWLIAHLYETHDFWHVLTGNYFNMDGEYGVAGFYMAQMPKFSFIAFFMSLLTLQHVWKKRDDLGSIHRAFYEGYTCGLNAKCVVGLDWESVYSTNLQELRTSLGIVEAGKLPTQLSIAA
ncbi:MAG: ubiquinone biosynthesis protein COQ4 [Zhongshania sp.]|jgi:ubiquinone biosynthesis protein COQ4